MENVSLMMACAQLGITACSLGLGAVGEPAVASVLEGPLETAGVPDWLLHPLAFSVALGIVVFLHMVLGEMVPKNIAIAGPERSALALGPPLAAVARILRPVIVTLNGLGNAVLRLAGVEPKDEVASAFTADEVASLVAESRQEGLLDDAEHELVSGALSFAGRTVSSVLVPMGSLTVLPLGASPADIQDATARTGFSRFPLAGPDGALAGYLHVKDVLDDDPATRDRPVPPEALRPLATVTGQESLEAALDAMRDRGAHLARVVGADGAAEGVVTLEDVLEELVGEVRDAAQATRRRA
jgi:CBS domain containing-hemolysin-like protein